MSIPSAFPASQAVSAYQAALRHAQAGAATSIGGAGTSASLAPTFETLLKGELEGAAKDLGRSETQSVQALAGKADLQQVVEAVTQAELSLQKVTAIRDRVISAYQEIMRMPV